MSDRKRNIQGEMSMLGSSKRPCDDSRISAAKMKKHVRTNDEIHRSITVCPILKIFLDSPQVERLRKLQQLGTASLVYNNANHTRLEHSLGVAHLAERLIKRIDEKQPSLGCTKRDILCVKLAGLLHDTGHGPFSHTYERFVKHHFPKFFETLSSEDKARYDGLEPVPEGFCHEDISMKMIDAALAHYGLEIDLQNLDKPLKRIGGVKFEPVLAFGPEGEELTSRDFVFVKECIHGEPIKEINDATGLTGFVGRPGWEKEWMYDIVSNRHSGLDVDKIDYFARDSKRSFGDGSVNEVVVDDAYVAWGDCTEEDGCRICQRCRGGRPYVGKHLMICYPEKTVKALVNFFNKRFELHDIVYWHKTTAGAAHMVCDILCNADPYFWIPATPLCEEPLAAKSVKSHPVTTLPISRAGLNAHAFTRLRDSVIDEISNTRDHKMGKARSLACRYLCRDLYKCPAEHSIDRQNPADLELWKMSEDDIKQGLLDTKGRHDTLLDSSDIIELFPDDFIVDKYSMHHGQKNRNPIENIRVVATTMLSRLDSKPRELPLAEKPNIEHFQAQTPIEQEQKRIRIFCRDNMKYDLLSHVFEQWLQNTRDIFCQTSSYDRGDAVAVSQSPGVRQSAPDDYCNDLDGPPQIYLSDSP
ncbi:hypothetical protein ACA910_005008 [Epithemia clementina (nom. ined.)]